MIKHKEKEKVVISFTKLDANREHYLKKLVDGEIEIYIFTKDFPPLKISLAELS